MTQHGAGSPAATSNGAVLCHDASSMRQQRLGDAIEEYYAAADGGVAIDRDLLLQKYNDIAVELAECLQNLDFIQNVAPQLVCEVNGRSGHSDFLAQPNLGDFRLMREIGRGGMGVVYEAEQISLGRRVALKVLPFAAMLDKQQLTRFKNEARAAATLDHPNIVAIHAVGTERGVHFYAMQLVEGQSLAQVIDQLRRAEAIRGKPEDRYISRSEPPQTLNQSRHINQQPTAPGRLQPSVTSRSPDDTRRDLQAALSTIPAFDTREYFHSVARLGIQAAEALDHAHQNGVLHRDVKPANLMVDDDGKLWITDFGLARIEADAGMTMTGDVLGTLSYMSPEQALAKRVVVDHRSDIYSLGVTLYELLTLQPVFVDNDRHELLRRIAFEEPQPPRRVNASIPLDVETILLKAIEKNPADRYATAQELADDLQRYIDNRSIHARPPTLRSLVGKWWHRHRRAAVAGLGAVGVVLSALTYVVGDRWQRISDASRFVEISLAAAHAALEANDTQLALQKLAQAQTRIDADHIAHLAIAGDVAQRRDETERFAEFESLLRKARLTRSGKEGELAAAQDALALYGVVDDLQWLTNLRASGLPDAHVTTVVEGAYELLLLNAEHLVFWCLEWSEPARQPQREKQCRQAREYLSKAASFHSPSRGYYWVLANCAVIMREPDEASRLRSIALQTPPHDAAELFYVNRDRRSRPVTPARGDPKYSFEENYAGHREMLRKDPSYYNGLFFMAYTLTVEGRDAEALPAWYGCLALRPDDVTALTNRAQTHLRLGHYEEAVADMERSLEIAPDSVSALSGAAWVLATCPKEEFRSGPRAVELATKAYEMSDFQATARVDPYAAAGIVDALATAYAAIGNFEAAARWSEKALALMPDDTLKTAIARRLESFRKEAGREELVEPTSEIPSTE